MEWTCNIYGIRLKSKEFNENESSENVTSMYITRTSNTTLPSDVYEKFSNLKNLRVELTDLTSLSENDTQGLHNLKNLYLGNNNLSTITDNALNNLPWLKLLYLNGNKLKQLPSSIFEKLGNLERLWLNDNHLTELHDTLLLANKNLNRLYLQNNKLLVIAEESFKNDNLKVLDLRGNVCINKWTFDTPIHAIKQLTEKDCNPSAENVRKSSIVMAKIIHELGIRDITLHATITAQELIIEELQRRLSEYGEDW